MGICSSCLRGAFDFDEDRIGELQNERTPLLQDRNGVEPQVSEVTIGDGSVSGSANADDDDKVKRDQALNEIVTYTGKNLIDVTSVSQPEVRTIGKSANEYKRILAELKFSNESAGTSPASGYKSRVRSVSSVQTVLPKKASNEQLTEKDKNWLNELAVAANRAINNEPPIKPVGELILQFQ
ncbi:hypothetical protein TRVA0_010S02938 [Trichomonascus vanleenenianus]|uniref:uncharacterized protein n=1 Tax=Trichomonascus vanleenenianus TaxID=2268995 RepID=UPI003ECA0060